MRLMADGTFYVGEAPRERDGTHMNMPLLEDTDTPNTDQPRIVKFDKKTARIRTKLPASCLVGRWRIKLQVSLYLH